MSGLDIAAEVAAALGEVGQEVGSGAGLVATLLRDTDVIGDVWGDDVGSTEEHPVTVVVSEYSMLERANTAIETGDVKLLVSATGAVPKTSDRIKLGDAEYGIIAVTPLAPAGTAVMYTCQARR